MHTVSDKATPPELLNFVGNAFNAKEGNFLSSPVFKLSFKDKHTIQWGLDTKTTLSIPDQISASVTTLGHGQTTNSLLSKEADYDKEFSAAIGVEFSGLSFSGSANSSYLYHGNLFTNTTRSYSLDQFLQSVLTFERIARG